MKISRYLPVDVLGSDNQKKNTCVTSTSDFGSMLKDNDKENVYETLNDLREIIETQGDKLAKTANINELKYYKMLVSNFLKQAVQISLSFEKNHIFDRRGRRHVYALVKKVNDRVNDLVIQFMAAEKDNVSIVAAIDDIRGMLIDLIM